MNTKTQTKGTYYEDLGIPRDATPADIKRAYRAKARQNHPDKGGDAEEFARVAHAYDVLKDSDRRQLYDATGKDRQSSIDEEVENILLQLFAQALLRDGNVDVLDGIRDQINTRSRSFSEERSSLNARRKKIEARRGKIKSKTDVNLAHLVIDAELLRIDQNVTNIDHLLEVSKACLKALKSYSEEKTRYFPTTQLPNEYRVRFDFSDILGVNHKDGR